MGIGESTIQTTVLLMMMRKEIQMTLAYLYFLVG
jgi:hypothetical protein